MAPAAAAKMTSSTSPVQHIFPQSTSLVEYGKRIGLPHVVRGTDKAEYSAFCQSIMVVPPRNNAPLPNFSVDANANANAAEFDASSSSAAGLNGGGVGGEVSIKDALLRVIAQSLRDAGTNYREKNVLALGYGFRAESTTAAGVRSNADLHCRDVNTVHSLLSTPLWQALANRLGDRAFRHLLSLPIFLPSTNGSYIQVAGRPANEIVHAKETKDGEAAALNPRAMANARHDAFNLLTRGTMELQQLPVAPAEHVQVQLLSRETLESLQIKGRQQLPRYAILYKYFGEQSPVLASQHPLHRLSVTSNTVAWAAFGLVRSLSRSRGRTVMNDVTPLGNDVRAVLIEAMGGVLKCYRRLNVNQLLRKHCPRQEAAKEKEKKDGSEDDEEVVGAKRRRSRSRSRGSRGGKAVQALRRSFLPPIVPAQPILPPVPGAVVPPAKKNDGPDRHKRRGRGKRTTTVGGRLFSRLVTSVNTEAAFKDAGLLSQEDHRPIRPLKRAKAEAEVARGASETTPGYNGLLSPLRVSGGSGDSGDSGGSGGSVSSSMQCEARDSQSVFPLEERQQESSARKDDFIDDYDSANANGNSMDCADNGDDGDDDDDDDDGGPRKRRKRSNNANTGFPVATSSSFPATASLPPTLPSLASSPLLSATAEDCGFRHAAQRGMLTEASTASTQDNSADVRTSPEYRAGAPFKDLDPSVLSITGLKRPATAAASAEKGPAPVLAPGPEPKPRQDNLSLAVPAQQISAFACSVLRLALPVTFWGSRHNLDALLSAVDRYVRLGCYETMTIGQLALKIRSNDIPWLRQAESFVQAAFESTTECGSDDEGDASPLSPSRARTLLLHSFLHWIVVEMLNPLLSCCFYCTEGEGRAGELLFYHKTDWARLLQKGADQLSLQFMPLAPSAAASVTGPRRGMQLQQQRLQDRALPAVRFVPKPQSLRPITNLRARADTRKPNIPGAPPGMPIVSNKALYSCLHVLKKIYNSSPLHAGFGAFGLNEIYCKLRLYVSMLKSKTRVAIGGLKESDVMQVDDSVDQLPVSPLPTPPAPLPAPASLPVRYYVCVCDLEKCYDNVKTAQLYNLVRDLLQVASPDDDAAYVIHKYSVTHYIASLERTISKAARYVAADGDMFTFLEASAEISQHYRNSLISDAVHYEKKTRQDILKLLQAHLFNHVVRLPLHTRDGLAKKFTQVTGIPQGSVLSPLLCNLYYGDAERKVFGSDAEASRLGLGDKSLCVRMMDDYIFISTDKSCAEHFLQRAHVSLKPFGGGINPAKTRVNFDAEVEMEGRRVVLQRIPGIDMTWCGLLVDTTTLEVKMNFARLLERRLQTSVTVDCAQCGVALRRVMKSFVRMKCHAIVLDAALNSPAIVMRTIYTMFLVAAMRTHTYLRKMSTSAGGMAKAVRHNAPYIVRCVSETVLFGARLVQSRTSKPQARILKFGSDGDENSEDGDDGRNDDEEESSMRETGSEGLGHAGVGADGVVSGLFSNYVRSSSSARARLATGTCCVARRMTLWLGLSAFDAALSCRPGVYAAVLRGVRYKLVGLEMTLPAEEVQSAKQLLEGCCDILATANWKC